MFSISYATMQDFKYIHEIGYWPPSPLAEKEIELKIRDKRCYILREGEEVVGILRFNMVFEFIPFLSNH